MISVAMASYNGQEFIKEQLDSILNQEIDEELEVVICDDCSKDQTRQILKEYADKDPRIKAFYNEQNLGFMDNFSKAISLCQGNLIALADQDDLWPQGRLQALKEKLGQKAFVCSNALLVDQNNRELGMTMKEVCNYKWVPENSFKLLKHQVHINLVQGSTILAQASFLKESLPIPQEIGFHDYWFSFKALSKEGFAYLDQCSLRYRRHQATVTESDKEQSFSKDQREHVSTNEERELYLKNNQERIKILTFILEKLDWGKREESFLRKTIKYYQSLNDKNLYSLVYFIANCKYIYLDKNIIRNFLRICKKTIGLIYWKLYLRRRLTK
ncbi:MAG: glycosyltransferase [Treponema sp.]|nr:glycosyltransferase [Treponema sp.]